MSGTHTHTVKNVPIDQWLTWIITVAGLTCTIVIFLYVNFLSKSSFEEFKQADIQYRSQLNESFQKRLERMEDKLDQLLTNSHK